MTIRDITALLEQSGRGVSQWSEAKFTKLLEQARDLLKGSSIDWDDGAGEDWGRLIHGRGGVALAVNRLVPLAIVVTPADARLLTLLDESGVIPITTSDWERPEFSADPSVAERVFRVFRWPHSPDEIDMRALSANDLWWMTV